MCTLLLMYALSIFSSGSGALSKSILFVSISKLHLASELALICHMFLN